MTEFARAAGGGAEFARAGRVAVPAPTGAALEPLRVRYGSWLRLDREQVIAERDEDPAQVRALQLVLRMERDRPPSWHAALSLAAQGCAALCLDPRTEPGGEWFDPVHDYCVGHIRKVTRRARAGHWDAVADLPGITLADGDTQLRVLLPGRVDDLDKRVSRLQVGGTDAPQDDVPPEPRPMRPALRMWLNPAVTMTLGKAMAQTGHAGMIAAALLARTNPDSLRRWVSDGLPTRAAVLSADAFAGLQDDLADPVTAWRDKGMLAVRDAGFTEIDPGTVTVIAMAPRWD